MDADRFGMTYNHVINHRCGITHESEIAHKSAKQQSYCFRKNPSTLR